MNYTPPPRHPTFRPPKQDSPKKPQVIQENGFTQQESMLLREALGLAGMQWLDGPGYVMGKKDQLELTFRAGESQNARWVVMAFPLYNMNDPQAVEICLHFLAEGHAMVHLLDFQYQVGINMDTENLEFLMQLPIQGVTAAQMSQLIQTFFEALAASLAEELASILKEGGQ